MKAERDKAEAKEDLTDKEKANLEQAEEEINQMHVAWKKQSVLGQVGQAIEPVVEPLGWDWRIGMATLASFPAREVMIGTLGIIFGQGEGDPGDDKYKTPCNGRCGRKADSTTPNARFSRSRSPCR